MMCEPGLFYWAVIGLVLLFLALRTTGKRAAAARRLAVGQHQHRQGRYAVAERTLREALAIAEGLRRPDPFLVAIILNSLGMSLHALARHDEAEAMFDRSLELFKGARRGSRRIWAAPSATWASSTRTRADTPTPSPASAAP